MVTIINSPVRTLTWCSDVIRSYQNVWGLALPFTDYCALLIDGFYCCMLYQWSHLGPLEYLGPFTPRTAGPLAVLLKQLSLFFIPCTQWCKVCPCTVWGSCLCLGLSALANPAPSSSPNPLSESSALHLLLCDGNLPGRMGSFLAEARNPSVSWCQVGSASEEGCMGLLAAVFRRLLVSCFFPASPWVHRCFRRLMSLEVWSQTSWLILYMKTQYLWQLNSNQ